MNGYLTVAQAAERACVSESLIYEACRTKQLVHYRPGVNGRGKILLLPEDVDQWMAAFRVGAAPPGANAAGRSNSARPALPLKHIRL